MVNLLPHWLFIYLILLLRKEVQYMNKQISTEKLYQMIENEQDLEMLSKSYKPITFDEYFKYLLQKYGRSKNYIIRETCADQHYARILFKGEHKNSFDFVVTIGIILGATRHEINKMLQISQNRTLYPQYTRDRLILHCIQKEKTLTETNIFLDAHGEKILMSKSK